MVFGLLRTFRGSGSASEESKALEATTLSVDAASEKAPEMEAAQEQTASLAHAPEVCSESLGLHSATPQETPIQTAITAVTSEMEAFTPELSAEEGAAEQSAASVESVARQDEAQFTDAERGTQEVTPVLMTSEQHPGDVAPPPGFDTSVEPCTDESAERPESGREDNPAKTQAVGGSPSDVSADTVGTGQIATKAQGQVPCELSGKTEAKSSMESTEDALSEERPTAMLAKGLLQAMPVEAPAMPPLPTAQPPAAEGSPPISAGAGPTNGLADQGATGGAGIEDGGDIEGPDVEPGEGAEVTGGPELPPGRARAPASQQDVAAFVQYCLKQWRRNAQQALRQARAELSKKARVASPATSSKRRQTDAGVASLAHSILAEAQELAGSTCSEDSAFAQMASTEPPFSGNAKEKLEKEAKRWWEFVVMKVAAKTCDARESKALQERLVTALRLDDPELAERIKLQRIQVEQKIEARLPDQTRSVGAELLRMVVREDGSEILEAAVETAMREAAASWADEKIRRAGLRLREKTGADALSNAALAELEAVARQALRPSTSRPPACSHAQPIPTPASSSEALSARVRTAAAPLEADLRKLMESISSARRDLARCATLIEQREAMLSGVGVGPGGTASRRESRSEVRSALELLCQQERFGEAFQRVVSWDRQSGPKCGNEEEPLSAWLCGYVLGAVAGSEAAGALDQASLTATLPETFLARTPCPLPDGELQLALMVLLLEHMSSSQVSLEQILAGMEWVLALQQLFEPHGPDICSALLESVGPMAQILGELQRGTAPQALVDAASSAERQRVAQSARLAAKQLELFRRVALQGP